MSAGTKACVSPHGFFSLILAAGALAEGFLRGELIATMTGLFLLVLHVFALVTVMLNRFRWNRFSAGIDTRPDGTFVFVPQSAGFEHSSRYPVNPVLSSITFRMYLRSLSYGDSYRLDLPIPAAFTGVRPALPPRGRYAAEYSVCVISDFAFLYNLTTKKNADLKGFALRVLPDETASNSVKTDSSASGNADGASSWLRSEELYETRQFRPGDDRRKINWKVFAHSGELTTREGELLPPPSREYSIVFWTPGQHHDRKHPDTESRIRLDALVSRAAATCRDLLRSGKNLRFPQFGNIIALHENPEADNIVMHALTLPDLNCSKPFSNGSDPFSREEVLCFTLPPGINTAADGTSRYREEIFSNMPGSGSTVTFYVGPAEIEKRKAERAPLLSRLIFFPEKPRTSGETEPFVSDRDIGRLVSLIEKRGFRAYPF